MEKRVNLDYPGILEIRIFSKDIVDLDRYSLTKNTGTKDILINICMFVCFLRCTHNPEEKEEDLLKFNVL